MALLSLLLTYKVSMVKTASVHCYNCVFFSSFFILCPEYVFQSSLAGQGRMEKWKIGGRKYFLLCYLSQSSKLLFYFVFRSVPSPRAFTEMCKYKKQLKEDRFEKQLQHIIQLIENVYREDVLRRYHETTEGDSVLQGHVYCMSPGCPFENTVQVLLLQSQYCSLHTLLNANRYQRELVFASFLRHYQALHFYLLCCYLCCCVTCYFF